MVKKPKGKQKADPQPAPKPTKQAPEPDAAHDAPLPIPPPHSPRQSSPPVPAINVQSPTNEAWSKAPTPKLVTHNIDDSHSGHAWGNQDQYWDGNDQHEEGGWPEEGGDGYAAEGSWENQAASPQDRWNQTLQRIDHANPAAAAQGWEGNGEVQGSAGGGAGGWGPVTSQKSSRRASKVNSPLPSAAATPAPPPAVPASSTPVSPRSQVPRVIQSTRAAFPPKQNKTSAKDDNWGNPLADTEWTHDQQHHPYARVPVNQASWAADVQEAKVRQQLQRVKNNQNSWTKWSQEAGLLPKVATTFTAQVPGHPPSAPPPPAAGWKPQGSSRNNLSQQQHAQVLHSLLSQPGQNPPRGSIWAAQAAQMMHARSDGRHSRHHKAQSMAATENDPWGAWDQAGPSNDRHKKHRSDSHRPQQMQPADSWGGWPNSGAQDDSGWGPSTNAKDPWGTIHEEEEEYDDYDDDGWGDEDEGYGDEDEEGWQQKKTFSKSPAGKHHQSLHGATPQTAHTSLPYDPKQSKTMNMAYGRAPGAFETTPVQVPTGQVPLIADSGRKAIKLAEKALFGRERPAKERIHWLFSPDQDERVTSMLKWVSIMSDALATLGLQKFLREGQRGALICNADFRVTPIPGGPPQPAFDWINIDTVQATLDRIMQESVIAYNPSLHTVVFVFLLSASRNSMAIWRRKVPIPEALRDKYRDEIQKVMDSLDPKYQVYLDEAPAPPPKKKKGFWRRLFGR